MNNITPSLPAIAYRMAYLAIAACMARQIYARATSDARHIHRPRKDLAGRRGTIWYVGNYVAAWFPTYASACNMITLIRNYAPSLGDRIVKMTHLSNQRFTLADTVGAMRQLSCVVKILAPPDWLLTTGNTSASVYYTLQRAIGHWGGVYSE